MGHSSEIRVSVLKMVQTPLSYRYTMKVEKPPSRSSISLIDGTGDSPYGLYVKSGLERITA
jgi:hypothetical protein